VIQAVRNICEKAKAMAFPGTSTPVDVAPTKQAGADYQNNTALSLFGELKKGTLPDGIKSPRDTAQKLVDAMRACDEEQIVAKLEVAGPGFINITLNLAWLEARVTAVVMHGVLPPPGKRRKVVVDFSSPNVAKEMHVGHLRSTIIGDTICRILSFCGHEVLRVNHVGDWGTQFGMLIAHLKAVFPNFADRPPPISDLQQFYKDAKAVFDQDTDFKARAHAEVVKLQSGDGSSRFAWQQICDVSRREFEKVYKRLDVVLTEVGESFYNEYIPAVIAHLEHLGSVVPSDGAKVIFPQPGSKHEQPLIVQKGDGGFGYDSTDMAAVWYRLLELQADWVIYVTDAGQGPHFELVFDASRAAGWKPDARLDHMPFGVVQRVNYCVAVTATFDGAADEEAFKEKLASFLNAKKVDERPVLTKYISTEAASSGLVATVSELGGLDAVGAATEALLAEGAAASLGAIELECTKVEKVEKFKTRSGETVRLVDLLDQAVAKMKETTAARIAAGKCDLSVDELDNAAKVLGYGAIKYADLKGNRVSNYVFSYDRMLDDKGNTAVYLLYAGARISSVFKKAGTDPATIDGLVAAGASVKLGQPAELTLARYMLRLPEVLELTLEYLLPSYICDFVYELCGLFSDFYNHPACKVLGSPEQQSRLILLRAVQLTLKKSYEMLGIGYLDRI